MELIVVVYVFLMMLQVEYIFHSEILFLSLMNRMKALESVKQKSSEIERMGMSAISFSLGLINVVMTAFILGRWPEHFWVWTAITIGPMLVWTFFDKIRSNTELFMLDFCWVANILLSIFSVLCFAQLFGGMESLRSVVI